MPSIRARLQNILKKNRIPLDGSYAKILKNYFDKEFYCKRYEDVGSSNIDPIEHYHYFGWKEGRDPAAFFSTDGYLADHRDVAAAHINPLLHYAVFGKKENRIVRPSREIQSGDQDPLMGVSAGKKFGGRNLSRSEISMLKVNFDEDYYRHRYIDIEKNKVDPFEHFIVFGWREGRDPAPWFSTRSYLSDYGDVEASGQNPFLHYLEIGKDHGYLPRAVGQTARLLRVDPQAQLVKDRALRDLLDLPPRLLDPSRAELPSDFAKLRIHWVVPEFARGGGGHMTIFRMVFWLEFFGHHCTIWIHDPKPETHPQGWSDDVIRNFVQIKAEIRPIDERFSEIEGDILVATGWQTVAFVCNSQNFRDRFYFVQDYEPYFYARGSQSLAAETTYSRELACLCASPWLAETLTERHGRWARPFWLAYDHKVYHPPKEDLAEQDRPLRIAFYARSATQRRAVELGLLALEALAARGFEFEVDFFGELTSLTAAPFVSRDHGVLSPGELADLYRACDIGLCFSSTNYSLVPQEMMACGLPVLELDVESTRRIFPDGVVRFCAPDPLLIAQQIEGLLEDADARAAQSVRALAWVSQFTWESSARMVETAIKERLSERLGCQEADRSMPERRSLHDVVINADGERAPSLALRVEQSHEMPHASVIIPTWQGGDELRRTLAALRQQKAPWPFEIVIIDSSSSDGTAEECQAAEDIHFLSIPQSEFSHGPTRNRAIAESRGAFIALLTQDAVPASEFWLYNLVSAVERDDRIAGAFGRHLPYPDHSDFVKRDIEECFQRFHTGPVVVSKDTDQEKWENGDQGWLQTLHFYSDNNSCMRRSVWEVIPYPDISYGEDQVWAQKIVQTGYAKAYSHAAAVYHSHDYGPDDTFKRAEIEYAFFRDQFGYDLLAGDASLDARIEALNLRDEALAKSMNIQEAVLARQKLNNNALISGYWAAKARGSARTEV